MNRTGKKLARKYKRRNPRRNSRQNTQRLFDEQGRERSGIIEAPIGTNQQGKGELEDDERGSMAFSTASSLVTFCSTVAKRTSNVARANSNSRAQIANATDPKRGQDIRNVIGASLVDTAGRDYEGDDAAIKNKQPEGVAPSVAADGTGTEERNGNEMEVDAAEVAEDAVGLAVDHVGNAAKDGSGELVPGNELNPQAVLPPSSEMVEMKNADAAQGQALEDDDVNLEADDEKALTMQEVNEFINNHARLNELQQESPEMPNEIQEILNEGLPAAANPQNENAANEIAQIENNEQIENPAKQSRSKPPVTGHANYDPNQWYPAHVRD